MNNYSHYRVKIDALSSVTVPLFNIDNIRFQLFKTIIWIFWTKLKWFYMLFYNFRFVRRVIHYIDGVLSQSLTEGYIVETWCLLLVLSYQEVTFKRSQCLPNFYSFPFLASQPFTECSVIILSHQLGSTGLTTKIQYWRILEDWIW